MIIEQQISNENLKGIPMDQIKEEVKKEKKSEKDERKEARHWAALQAADVLAMRTR